MKTKSIYERLRAIGASPEAMLTLQEMESMESPEDFEEMSEEHYYDLLDELTSEKCDEIRPLIEASGQLLEVYAADPMEIDEYDPCRVNNCKNDVCLEFSETIEDDDEKEYVVHSWACLKHAYEVLKAYGIEKKD